MLDFRRALNRPKFRTGIDCIARVCRSRTISNDRFVRELMHDSSDLSRRCKPHLSCGRWCSASNACLLYITLAGLIRLSLPKGEDRVRVGGFEFCSVQNRSPQSSPLAARGEAGILSKFLYVK